MGPRGGDGARRAALIVALVAALAGLVGVAARSTYGAQVSSDEPQYLLTALSLGEDLDLDISDEIERRQFEPFHEISLNAQTTPVDGAGRRFSPHDPLLPAVLAPAMRVGGWVGARMMLVGIGALTGALTAWTAVRRFGVAPGAATVAVGAFFAGVPLAPYGSQVYPEIVAALAVVAAVACSSAPAPRTAHLVGTAAALAALPWLSVKYVPVATAIGLLVVWRLGRSRRWVALGSLGAAGLVAGVIYVAVHQRVYGGWTVYAAGDHFLDDGEFAVIGTDPNYVGRSRRLVGLLVDRRFGLIPWAPIWLLAPAALVRVVTDRVRGASLLVLPFAAAWLTATFVALTMHGWWSPGRQIVVVAPLAAIAVCHLVTRHRRLIGPVAALGLAGAVNWMWLAIEATIDRRTIIVDFYETAAPPYRAVEWLFAQGWPKAATADLSLGIWTVAIAATIAVALVAGRRQASGGAGVGPRSELPGDDGSPDAVDDRAGAQLERA